VPTAGLIDQVTPEFDEPPTVAVNCCHWDPVSDTLVGVKDTDTGGTKLTMALADFVGSAALVAVTVTL
jgi:hypothetical protein